MSTQLQKRQPPLPGPYNQMVRRLQGKMRQVQDELALESVTNIEFEEASRRSFDFLSKQVKALKDAFNTLTDTLLQELDGMGNKVDDRMNQLVDKVEQKLGEGIDHKRELLAVQENQAAIVRELGQASAKQQEIEKSSSQLARDVDAVLSVIPKLEDKIDCVASDIGKVSENVNTFNHRFADDSAQRALSATQNLEVRVRDLVAELRDEMEQKNLKLQRSISRQLETMSKVLVESTGPASPSARRVDFDLSASPTTFSTADPRLRSGRGESGVGGAGSARAFSPIREASLRNLRLP